MRGSDHPRQRAYVEPKDMSWLLVALLLLFIQGPAWGSSVERDVKVSLSFKQNFLIDFKGAPGFQNTVVKSDQKLEFTGSWKAIELFPGGEPSKIQLRVSAVLGSRNVPEAARLAGQTLLIDHISHKVTIGGKKLSAGQDIFHALRAFSRYRPDVQTWNNPVESPQTLAIGEDFFSSPLMMLSAPGKIFVKAKTFGNVRENYSDVSIVSRNFTFLMESKDWKYSARAFQFRERKNLHAGGSDPVLRQRILDTVLKMRAQGTVRGREAFISADEEQVFGLTFLGFGN